MNIYLIGYRCTGKTTLGRALANRLEWEFIDMDDRLVAEAGCSITRMVAECGWTFFREQERALLSRLAAMKEKAVVSTGGGIVLDPHNASVMRASGWVVWLRCHSKTILRLMQADPRTRDLRPALTDLTLQQEIESTLGEREPMYRSAAHIAIDTDDFHIQRLCSQILENIERLNDNDTPVVGNKR